MSSRASWVLTAAMSVAAFAADWPQFLGPLRNGTSPIAIAETTLRNPKLLWKKDIGEGFSAPVVASGKLILFHRVANEGGVEGLNTATGDRVWRFAYETNYRDDFGFDPGPRGTPTIN